MSSLLLQINNLPEEQSIPRIKDIISQVANFSYPVVESLVKKIEVIKANKLKTEGDVQVLRNQLTSWKLDYKTIEDKIKAITKPAYEFKKEIDAKLKTITNAFNELKEVTEDKITDFLAKQEKKGNEIEVKGMITKKIVVVKHWDPKKVPVKYIELNRDAVEKDILEGKKIEGVTFEIIEETTLRG